MLIHLIIMFQIVENNPLKNYEYMKFFQIMIRTTCLESKTYKIVNCKFILNNFIIYKWKQ